MERYLVALDVRKEIEKPGVTIQADLFHVNEDLEIDSPTHKQILAYISNSQKESSRGDIVALTKCKMAVNLFESVFLPTP